MIGDVIFVKKKESIISRLIAYLTKSEYTHVGLIVGYDELTNEVTVIESERFVNTRINRFKIDKNMHVIYSTGEKTQEQKDMILKFAYKSIGTKYDYMQILGLFISITFGKERYFNSANKYICSELIDIAYYKSGVKRITNINLGNITPQELLEVYEFKVRKEA